MTSDELEKTAPGLVLPVVLAIHCSTELHRRCVEACTRSALSVRECDLLAMAQQSAQRRPIAIIVPSYLHEFDPTEFEALAKDVAATLLIVDEEISQADLDELIADAGTPRRKGPRADRGRYSVVGGCSTEVTRPASPSASRVRLRVDEAANLEPAQRRSRVG